MNSKLLLFFGCISQAGHYLFSPGERTAYLHARDFPKANPNLLQALERGSVVDGLLIPPGVGPGVYRESIIPPFRFVAWADYTGDSRPGSNSVLIGYGYDSAEEMLDEAPAHFPTVMKRQQRPTRELIT